MIKSILGKELTCQIDKTARRIDRAYRCNGNQVAAIRAYLTNEALTAIAEFKEGGAR